MVGVYKSGIKSYNEAYYELNKDRIKQNSRKYYHSNREKLLNKMTCVNCQGSYSLASISTHLKTKKHLKAIQNQLMEEIRKFENEEGNAIDQLMGNNYINGNIIF
jgi:ATP-dependent Lon protease